MERTLETNAAVIALTGTALKAFLDRRFLVVPAVVTGLLLQHALQGRCPPVPFFRQRGIRRAREIEAERHALKALRGDDHRRRQRYRGGAGRRARLGTQAAAPAPSRVLAMGAGLVMATAAVALFVAEKRRPLRQTMQAEPRRTLRNLTMGAMSMAVVALLQRPIVDPLAARVAERRWGLAQALPLPAWARDAVAFLLLDYTIYVWHVLTHKVPLLWRFHLVHHVDLDMDTTTAMRFHFVDMALSVPWRAGQVLVCGASPRALLLWQSFFFTSVVFHHSNLRLPLGLERRLVYVLTTPRLHGIHHSAVQQETNSNWSSGLSFWDWLHGTIRTDVPQDAITIGVPAYRDPAILELRPSLELPFVQQRPAWPGQEQRRTRQAGPQAKVFPN